MAETIRVVIVDDERLFAELLRVALRSAEGIEVLAVVHDVKSAIVALNEHRPDVVIADYHLPDGTGADLARAVRGSLPDTSVLVLTADPSAVTLNDVARFEAVAEAARLGLVTLESWTRDRIGPPRGGSGPSPERS